MAMATWKRHGVDVNADLQIIFFFQICIIIIITQNVQFPYNNFDHFSHFQVLNSTKLVSICPLGKNDPIDFFTFLLKNKTLNLYLVDYSHVGHLCSLVRYHP
jgi:hypothetical protein